jgi:formylglycine-generating enzyme required for sulfatase activity
MVAVGTKPLGDGRWGQSDLAGNVWEWTLDWYATYVSTCTDCGNLTPALYRVIRGGSFFDDVVTYLRAGYRNVGTPADRYNNFGVRCARTLFY